MVPLTPREEVIGLECYGGLDLYLKLQVRANWPVVVISFKIR